MEANNIIMTAEAILSDYEFDVHYYGGGRDDILTAMRLYAEQFKHYTPPESQLSKASGVGEQEGYSREDMKEALRAGFLFHAIGANLKSDEWLSTYKPSPQAPIKWPTFDESAEGFANLKKTFIEKKYSNGMVWYCAVQWLTSFIKDQKNK